MTEEQNMAKKKRKTALTGVLSKNRRGFGFVTCEGMDRDVFVAAGSMNGAMDGDEVELDLVPEYLWRGSPEGIVDRVLSRNTVEVVGTFERSKKFGFVVPDSRKFREDIFVRREGFRRSEKRR